MKTTISIEDEDGTNSADGESGNAGPTGAKLANWPTIDAKFSGHVEEKEMPERDEDGVEIEGKTYMRGIHACAEPNAYANLLDEFNDKDQDTVTAAWLGGLTFPAKAIDSLGNNLWPCPVCGQWVTSDGLPLEVNGAVIPDDPIKNKKQIAEEKQQADFVGKIEGFKRGDPVSFDTSEGAKSSLSGKLEYYDSLKADKGKHKDIKEGNVKPIHDEAWAGIIHKNNAPEFVNKALEIDGKLQDELVVGKDFRDTRTITPYDERAIALMEEYYKLCADKIAAHGEKPDAKIIVNLIKELEDAGVGIEGDLADVSRPAAVLPVPQGVKDYALADIILDIGEDGKVSIYTSGGEFDWDSGY